MFAGDCCSSTCSSSASGNLSNNSNILNKKTVHVLDNELRLRSIMNTINCNHSSRPLITDNHIGRFDELTHFFNVINGLFRQSAFTLGLSTCHLSSILPKMNVGVNMYIDQQSIEQRQIDFFKNLTLYGLIGGNEIDTVVNNDQQENMPRGIIKFNTSDKNLMLNVNHRWTPLLTSTLRFGTIPQNRLWSHVEYRRPNETYELTGEYITGHSSGIQFNYLSCLCQGINYQIDGGVDLRVEILSKYVLQESNFIFIQINPKEKLADIGLRLKNASNSIVFKCDLCRPLKHYFIGIQHYFNTNLTVGLLAEKIATYSQQSPIKFSLMSQWSLDKTGLRINSLINTQNELGLALTHQIRYFPLVLQTFGLYSWSTRQYKWGVGLQLLL